MWILNAEFEEINSLARQIFEGLDVDSIKPTTHDDF